MTFATLENGLLPKVVTLVGMVMVAPEQPRNASAPMLVSVDGSVTVATLL